MAYRLQALLLRGLIALLRPLPYPWAARVVGRLMRIVVRLAPPLHRRADANLALIHPELTRAERGRLVRLAARNAGRALATIWFADAFARHVAGVEAEGPGLAVLRAAHAEGRPAILVSGHFGAWEAIRHVLRREGIEVGALYRRNNNPHYEPIFVAGLAAAGGPNLPRGREGLREMLRHLKGGGVFAILVDQAMHDGAPLDFLGRPARTSLAAAELALRFDAPLIPVFAPVVQGMPRVELEAPVPPSTPEAMMAEVNRRLGSRVEAHPSQWYWFHRRWKTYG